jgi:hypothetical protein
VRVPPPSRSHVVEAVFEVSEQAGLVLVDDDGGRGVTCHDDGDAVLDPDVRDEDTQLVGDVDELGGLRGGDVERGVVRDRNTTSVAMRCLRSGASRRRPSESSARREAVVRSA